MKTKILLLSLIIGSTGFAGGGSSVGLGNPAAENCIKLEGTLEYGEQSNCVVDEWHLWIEMNKRGLTQHHQYPGHPIGLPNPAAVNCIDIGGQTRTLETPEGQLGLCVVEQWTLFRAINVISEPIN